ncbi:mycofactocin precursor MftA [Sciscionella marina]|nr:mycofactocin precursor MftA [Sciscionella marina]
MADDSRVAVGENDVDAPDVVTSDLLVEEVSIDGMCGVY